MREPKPESPTSVVVGKRVGRPQRLRSASALPFPRDQHTISSWLKLKVLIQ